MAVVSACNDKRRYTIRICVSSSNKISRKFGSRQCAKSKKDKTEWKPVINWGLLSDPTSEENAEF